MATAYRQLSYPKSHHCPRAEDTIQEYLNDMAFATKFFGDRVAKEKAERTEVSTVSVPDGFGSVETDVAKYLAEHRDIHSVLSEVVDQVRKNFGKRIVCDFDLLEDGLSKKLFIKILTKASAEKALSQLDSFDRTWWYQQPHSVRSKLEFVLEFV